jgi:ribonuclease HII
MGYATERHRAAIDVHGAVPRLHRASFAPFRLVEGGIVEEGFIEESLIEGRLVEEA